MNLQQEINWYVIHAKPSREAVAAMNIRRLGLEVFLPEVKVEKLVWGMPQVLVRPLFPGYLFARFRPNTYLHLIRYARGVRRVVSAGETPLPVDEGIIHAIRLRVAAEGYVVLCQRPLQPGDQVIVKEGPLQGLGGIFEQELDSRERVVILLNAIEYQARVLIEKQCLNATAKVV